MWLSWYRKRHESHGSAWSECSLTIMARLDAATDVSLKGLSDRTARIRQNLLLHLRHLQSRPSEIWARTLEPGLFATGSLPVTQTVPCGGTSIVRPPEIPIKDIVDRCRVWESHADTDDRRVVKPTSERAQPVYAVSEPTLGPMQPSPAFWRD